jgi:hypothetical protein
VSPPVANHEAQVRARCAELAQLLIANEPKIHYPLHDKRTMTIHQIDTMPKLHTVMDPGKLSLDCSQTVTLVAHLAGAKDPNGADFTADGFTGTLVGHCAVIPLEQVKPGDLVVYGPGTGEHVCMVIEPGLDPLLLSHGQDKGPIAIRQSVEAKFHASPVRALRLPI